ncbi:MAG: hypothetical protein AAFU03_08695, partial [Bacteroidota bacterium]
TIFTVVVLGCAQPWLGVKVNIVNSLTPQLTTAVLCENTTPFPLTNLEDPSFAGGTWSGPGVNANFFQPTGLNGTITLTFEPDDPCAQTVNTIIEVEQESVPLLTPATICGSAGNALDLNTLLDPAFPTGNWIGLGVSGNQFFPDGLSGIITLSFQSNEDCVGLATTTVTIEAPTTPQLEMSSVCLSATNFDLNSLIDPAFPNGTWFGPGVNGTIFDATGLSGLVTLSFISSNPCTEPANTTIEVTELVLPNLSSAVICQEDTPLDLSSLLDPAFPLGTWSGPGVSGGIFSPLGQNGSVALTFIPDDLCSQAANTTVNVNETPVIQDLTTDCTTLNDEYIVSFSIIGGDPNSYTVNSQPSAPNFVSDPISSGQSYNFLVEDANGCGVVSVSGSFNCDCTTFAGTMNFTNSPSQVCIGDVFTATANPDAVLDASDIRLFVLHDEAGPALGNILAVNTIPEFTFPPGGELGITYFISAVAANDDGTDSIDSSDACLSVAAGVPVTFYQSMIEIGSGGAICAIDCIEIPLSFTGIAPFELNYQISNANGTTQEVFNTLNDDAILEICPATLGLTSGQTIIQPLSMSDANGCDVSLTGFTEILLDVLTENQSNITPSLCTGETITIGSTVFSQAFPSGTIILENAAANGCDSVVNVNLTFLPVASGQITETLCSGGSLLVNGTIYDESNPTGTEIFLNGSINGCDSIVIIDLSFAEQVTFNLTETLCPGEELTVNGVSYNAANPTGSETILGGSVNGCDSVVNVNLSFLPIASGQITETLCSGGSLLVNATV